MKYFIPFAVLLFFSSCIKEYYCECTINGNENPSSSTLVRDTKNNARERCQSLAGPVWYQNTWREQNCELK